MFCTVCGYYNDFSEKDNTSDIPSDEDLLDDDWSADEIEEVEIEEDDDISEDEFTDDDDDKSSEKELDKILKAKKKKTKDSFTSDKQQDEDERYISAYIGDDYKSIGRHIFNVWAFLLNWIYFLYKKLLISGIIGIVITYIVIVFFRDYLLIYIAIVLPLSGLFFNSYYKAIVRMRINRIKEQYDGSDPSSLEDVCSEKGGSNYIYPLVIYFIFLVAVIFSIIKIDVNPNHNTKYWKENSENKANCNSHLKSIYEEIYTNHKDSRVVEGVCKIVKTTTKEYQLYLKTEKNNKIVYYYYRTNSGYMEYIGDTDELIELQKKDNLTEFETDKKSELEKVKTTYDESYKKSQEEDKLIKTKKNTSEKLNYVFSREEVIR